MSQISDILQTIDGANKQFASTLDKSQARLLAEALDLAKTLDIKNGKIAPSIENLKRISSIKAKLNKAVVNSDYLKSVKDLVGNFDTIQAAQNAYFYPMAAKFTAAKKQALIKEISIDNTISQLTETGLAANVTDEIRNKLLKSVTSGAQYNDLVAEMTQYLTDTEESPGALSKYAQTYVNTSLNQFAGNNNKLMTEDLGMEWFRYVGSNKETSREFCIHLEAKDYVHVSEIPEILRGHIDGHKCKIYQATGLPYGMIDGTTPDNFMTNRGGWNCGHQLIPVLTSSVPASAKAKIPDTPLQQQAKTPEQIQDKKPQSLSALKTKYIKMKAEDLISLKNKMFPGNGPVGAEEKMMNQVIEAKIGAPPGQKTSTIETTKPPVIRDKFSTKIVDDYLKNRDNPAVSGQRLTKAEYEAMMAHPIGGGIKYDPKEIPRARIDAAADMYGLTYEEKALLYSYTGSLYVGLNSASRDGIVGMNTLMNDRIGTTLDKIPPYKGEVIRLIDVDPSEIPAFLKGFKGLNPNQAVTFDQLLSTSTNTLNDSGLFGGNVAFQIKSKTGRDISELAMSRSEKEVLFKADAKFKVISIKSNQEYNTYKYTVIKLEEI